jgi:hypothetical protein
VITLLPQAGGQSLPLSGGSINLTKRLIVGITLCGCLALCIGLQAQGGSDGDEQIKKLQQGPQWRK